MFPPPPPRLASAGAAPLLLLASWLMLATVALGDPLAGAPQTIPVLAAQTTTTTTTTPFQVVPKLVPQAPQHESHQQQQQQQQAASQETTTLQTTTNASQTRPPQDVAASVLFDVNNNNNTTTTPQTQTLGNLTSIQSANANLTAAAASQMAMKLLWAPRSERAPIVEMFQKFFIKARSHDDLAQKEIVRDGVIRRMRELGFETSFLQKSRFEFRRRPAFSYNMISILPGKWRQTRHERIVLVGAHWDSATKAPGVDDNGSGSVCLLEIARLLSKHQCRFNHTIMLVWFDYEEQGKYGSEFFVNDYLYPYELDKFKSQFVGAFILDMILVRDKEPQTQLLPQNLKPKLSEFFDELEREKNRGDFLATWARKRWDEPLENVFRQSWLELGYESRTFKAMRPELPQTRLPNADERYEWKDFFRSDHASFWFPPLTSPAVRRAPNRTSSGEHASLNAILLTDLGPWRQSYQKCYHSTCDDEHLLTEGNLAFMQQVVDALVLSLLRLGQGECQAPPQVPATSSSLLASLEAAKTHRITTTTRR